MSITSARDLEAMRRVGRVVARTLAATRAALEPGMTTAEVDAVAAGVLERHGARSAPALVYDFPGTICISVDDEIVHGVPGPRRLEPGDLVKLDVTAELDGYMADAAVTVPMPPERPADVQLARAARVALSQGLAAARAGRPVAAIGRAVERSVRGDGFTVLRELTGHGIGRTIHEPPTVPNYDEPRLHSRLEPGLVIAVEPLIAAGRGGVVEAADGWTIRTRDGARAAHAEHTVVVTRGRPIVLTAA